jgi:hypothetical protein
VGKLRDRDSSIRRRAASRDPKHRVLVVCEGKKTEPKYLKAFQHAVRNRLVHVEINDDSGVPMTLVTRAAALRSLAEADAQRERDDNLKFDETWCVFDVDEHPRLEEARDKAAQYAISLAISNPCFELWAVLHYQAQAESLDRHTIQKLLGNHIGDYNKELPFEKLWPNYETAVERAAKLQKDADSNGDPCRNPTTGVFRLTEKIRKFGQSQ